MKLYTRTGDAGETSLFDGTRVAKDDPRVAAYGDVDELNATLGFCRAAAGPGTLDECLAWIQNDLFVVGSELATPRDSPQAAKVPCVRDTHCETLETWIDESSAAVPPLKRFVLPGGTELAARLHLARTCCRRAERSIIPLVQSKECRAEVLIYLNRLSDLLFAWARQANHQAGVADVTWDPAEPPQTV